ncbi:MAG TPA: glycosyltransferase family 4 protein [Candidatus Acidoferrum sp.]|jgi:glycosyltransferase involved in cell wall biosynthesis|nr:glycosyltransferase family 4 protein [Candidatus Acidoferrum sp.]
MNTLQIGMTASRRHISGTDRYYLSLLRSLPALGVGVRGVVLGDPAGLDDPVPGVESFAPEGASRWRRWTGLRAAVARGVAAADLVVSHGAPHAFPALDAIRRRPLVVHFHGPWALEGRADGLGSAKVAIRRFQERSVYGRGRRFIVLSRAFGEILEREYGADPAAIRIVPGGVDLRRFGTALARREARERLGWAQDRPTLVTVRRLVPTKGLENLIDAAAEVRREVPDVLIVIVGTGPLAGDLQRRVEGLGLGETIRFAGHVAEEQLPIVYRAADLLVVPTVALEGFGLVVVEALACGTPALVTPVGGLPEVVSALEPGLVMTGFTARDLAAGIRDALSGRLKVPDEDACVRYADRFDWPVIAQQVRDVYREAA